MEMTEAERSQVVVALMAARQAALKSMLWGVAFIVTGLTITGITYVNAAPGDSYAIFWGLPAYGAYRFLRGWYYYARPHRMFG